MRWFWRLITLVIFFGLIKTLFVPQSKTFIAWPEEQNWVEMIQGELRQWQRLSQDLPASIEVEVRRLWKNYQPNGNGKEV